MEIKNNIKVGKTTNLYEICRICCSKYHIAGRARHKRTRKHNDCDYINNKMFEFERIKPKDEKEILIIK